MFKSLQEQIVTKVNQTNQIIRSTIRPNDTENNSSRLDSSATDINYVAPVRQSFPPSDIESEYNDDDHENVNKLLKTYKNKFQQLKRAYDEVEHEKENIKDVLQKTQDAFLRQKEDLREKLTREQQTNAQLKKEIKLRDQQIEELTKDQKELQIQREKRVALMQERDFLQQQLSERQTITRDPNMEAEFQLAKERITKLHQSLTIENEQHVKAFDALKNEYENLTNELSQTKQAKDEIQSLFNQTDELLKAALKKLQHNQEQISAVEDEPILSINSSQTDEINRLQRLLDEQIDTCSSKDTEIQTLKNHIVRFEQETIEKDRQITECDEKIEEIQSALEQSKESNEKLRKALQKKNDQSIESNSTEIHLQKLTEDYEQRLNEQEIEYNVKLKAIAKEMSTQIDEKERSYQQQLKDFIQNNQKIDTDRVNNSEQRVINAEQRASMAEAQISRLDEQLKENQLDHYQIVQELQDQIRTLTKQKPLTAEHFSQTINEASQLIELTELDYLKEVFRGYISGTDPITMVKVICAVLRYTDEETLSIIEHEKLRQSRWLNPTK